MSLEDPLNLEMGLKAEGPTTSQAPPSSSEASTPPKRRASILGKLEGNCIQCHAPMGKFLGSMSEDGPLHNECVAMYKRLHVERCVHCDNPLRDSRMLVQGKKLHPECVSDFKAGVRYVQPQKMGMVKKFAVGRSLVFGRQNWKDRFLILSMKCASGGLAYFETEADGLAYLGGGTHARPKGMVQLTGKECRLITKPTFKHHKASHELNRELIIVFKENGKEYRLLLQFTSFQERAQWIQALETYIKNVDDPVDDEP